MTTRRPIFVRRQKRVAPVRPGSRREINNLNHIGSLQANSLALLVLDCERANRQNLDHIGFLKANELVGSDARS